MFSNESKMSLRRILATGLTSLVLACGDSGPIKPNPNPEPQPSISLITNLVEDIDIGYNVTFTNLNQITLNVSRNGFQEGGLTRTITSSNYSGTYNDLEKGEYCFIGCSVHVYSNR